MTTIKPLDQAERDLVLLALAILSLDRPGWVEACADVAIRVGELSFPPADDPRGAFHTIRACNADRWQDRPLVDGGAAELARALEESVKLQSHYAKLLNEHDGGRRQPFADANAWLTRLRETRT